MFFPDLVVIVISLELRNGVTWAGENTHEYQYYTLYIGKKWHMYCSFAA
jgi:hypothetical protein